MTTSLVFIDWEVESWVTPFVIFPSDAVVASMVLVAIVVVGGDDDDDDDDAIRSVVKPRFSIFSSV